jgi:hypothetical protein
MNPLAAGWFDTIIALLSAVMASGWVIMGVNFSNRGSLVTLAPPLNPNNSLPQLLLRQEIDTDRRTERRNLIRLSYLSS